MQRQPVGVDAQHGEVVGGVLADDLRFDRLAFFEADGDLDRVLDHVVVGEDRAVGVDHDARAGRRALALGFAAEQVERRFGFCTIVEVTNATPGASLHVDLVRGQARALLRGVGGRRGRRLDGRDGRLVVAQAAGGGDDGDDDAAAEQGGDERDGEHAFHVRRG